jgi:tRNA-specific adenosine deaminase 2
MCASALRQVGIKRVVFGAGNERFGGNGSVLPVHSDAQLKNAPAYEAVGGYYREDAIMLLRRFYLTENVYAPNPRSKAKRVLKTYFQPPGVSMHGPNGQNLKKGSRRRNGRTRSSTPGAGSDAGESGSGAEAVSAIRRPVEDLRRELA